MELRCQRHPETINSSQHRQLIIDNKLAMLTKQTKKQVIKLLQKSKSPSRDSFSSTAIT